MAKFLKTEFIKVATSGHTIDGREIPESDIQDMADNYDPKEYTAVINYEHLRYFGNFGTVAEVKTERDSKDRLCLFAKLIPGDDLLYLNRQGQKLFSSIEIQPNFAQTGKAYLAGLAVTDTPASLGTDLLQFNTKTDNTMLLEACEIGTLDIQEERSRFYTFFKSKTPSPKPLPKTEPVLHSTTPPQHDSSESNSMDKKQFEQLNGNFEKLTLLVSQRLPNVESDGDNTNTPTDEPSGAISVDAFNGLKTDIETMQESVTALTKTVNDALADTSNNTKTGDDAGDNENPEVI